MRYRLGQHEVVFVRAAEVDQKHLDQMRALKVFVPSLSDQLVLATQKGGRVQPTSRVLLLMDSAQAYS